MHHHCEIVMPHTDDVEEAVKKIMTPFNEDIDTSDENAVYMARYSFWDWYEIGGRWSGCKQEASLGLDRIAEFRAKLTELKITVSGIQFGKQTLEPTSQTTSVDLLWGEHFPSEKGKPCSLFSHSGRSIEGDTMALKDLPEGLEPSRVIFANPGLEDKLEASFMVQDRVYNGVSYLGTDWDGKLSSAFEMQEKAGSHRSDEWKEHCQPKDDWLVVTVDYHSQTAETAQAVLSGCFPATDEADSPEIQIAREIMSYFRVMPRDLFNESKLLKCMGRLSLLINDGLTPEGLGIYHDGEECDGEECDGFDIQQDEMDGAIFVSNLVVTLRGKGICVMKSPLNSKASYPLVIDDCEIGEITVFDESGAFSSDFLSYCENVGKAVSA